MMAFKNSIVSVPGPSRQTFDASFVMAMIGSKSNKILNKMLWRDYTGELGQLKHVPVPLFRSSHQDLIVS